MISVVIPAYNREHTVLRAVNSVLEQTYRDLEVILVDDGSTDGTREILQTIKDSRFRYVYQDNAGACAARNHGIRLAQGEWIAFHDSDDVWHLDKLEKQWIVLQDTGADIVFCKLIQYQDGREIDRVPRDLKEGYLDPVVNLFGIGTQTLLVRREVLEEIRFDEALPRFQEFEMLVRAAEKYRIYCMEDGLVDYYIGADSISSNPRKLSVACDMILSKHPWFAAKYPLMVKIMAARLEQEARRLCADGDPDYRIYLEQAHRYDDSWKMKIKWLLDKVGVYRLLLSRRL